MYRNIIDIYSIEKLIIYLKKIIYIYIIYIYRHIHTRSRTRTYTYCSCYIRAHLFTFEIHLVMYAAVCAKRVPWKTINNENSTLKYNKTWIQNKENNYHFMPFSTLFVAFEMILNNAVHM